MKLLPDSIPWRFAHLDAMTPKEAYRRSVYWGTIALSVLVLGFASFHIQSIPAEIQEEISKRLEKRPWINDYVRVDGRDIYLSGEIEPESGIDFEVDQIEQVPGVRRVFNVLIEYPRPSAHLRLQRSDDEFVASGRLSGDILEQVMDHLKSGFPGTRVKDQISIDDRLGRPLWIEGFGQSLEALRPVSSFELNGWRDRIDLTGTTADPHTQNSVGYSIPASLVQQVDVVNRLRAETASDYPDISIILDWSGSEVSGTVPSQQYRQDMIEAVTDAFGIENLKIDISVDSGLEETRHLSSLIRLLWTLNQVQELRLESTGEGYIVWGRVDSPIQLGQFLAARNQLGLGSVLQNRIAVSRPSRGASVALFSDQRRAIVNGILPTIKSKQLLFADITDILPAHEVVDLVSIEPNVAHSEWLLRWPHLLSGLPGGVIGITIDEQNLLLTGSVQDRGQLTEVETRINRLFPETNILNWLTTTD